MLVGSIPNNTALPEVGLRRPSSRLIEVVLPAPFGPSIATTSPSSMSMLTPFKASTLPYFFVASMSWAAAVTPPTLGLSHAECFHPDHRRRAARAFCLEGRVMRRVSVHPAAASRSHPGRTPGRGRPLAGAGYGAARPPLRDRAGHRQSADGGL